MASLLGSRTAPAWQAATLLALMVSSVASAIVWAEREHEGHRYHSPHWEFDMRHNHNHYYPAREYVVPRLPPGYLDLTFEKGHLFFHSGVWFRPRGPEFVVVRPPVGIRLGLLPNSYSTIWSGGTPYYYANGAYYTAVPNTAEYMVVDPPPGYDTGQPQLDPYQFGASVPLSPMSPQQSSSPSPPQSFFVYPRDGQTQKGMMTDRQECHDWRLGKPVLIRRVLKRRLLNDPLNFSERSEPVSKAKATR